MNFFEKLFRKPAPKPVGQTVPQEPQGPHLSRMYTYGCHLYRRPEDDESVVFIDPPRKFKRLIVGHGGDIYEFPGVEEAAMEYLRRQNEEVALATIASRCVRYRTDFSALDGGGYRMGWQVQPDGRYWEDETGFGGTSDEEIILYADLDANGAFTGPFRLNE